MCSTGVKRKARSILLARPPAIVSIDRFIQLSHVAGVSDVTFLAHATLLALLGICIRFASAAQDGYGTSLREVPPSNGGSSCC